MKAITVHSILFLLILAAASCSKSGGNTPVPPPPADTTVITPPTDTSTVPPADTTTTPPKDTTHAQVKKYITMVVSTAFTATNDSAGFVEETFSDGYTDFMGLTTTKGSNVSQHLANPGSKEPLVTMANSRWELLYPNHTTKSFLDLAPLADTGLFVHEEVIIDSIVYEVFPETVFTIQGLTAPPDNGKFTAIMGRHTAWDRQAIKYQPQ